ncbi:MAG: major capsid protein, partial [Sneathiellaceae bacterium]
AISIGYRNTQFVSEEVLPTVPVTKKEFTYNAYPIAESFRLPDTHVGRKSAPNMVELSATRETDTCVDHGLDDGIPQDDIDQAPPGRDPRDRAVMQLTDYIALGREKETADLVFDADQYPTANKDTLTSTAQWSHASSNPVTAVLTALDACLMRPNRMVMGQAVWTKLRTNPVILKAVHGNLGDAGAATRQQVADLFELEQLIVGTGWYNSAAPGQDPTLVRVWGKHAALYYHNPLADTQQGLTFGLTAQYGAKIAGTRPDADIGLRGGQRVRVGETRKALIVAAQAAFLFEDAVA